MAKETNNKKLNINPTEELKILRQLTDLTSSQLDLELILKEVVKVVTENTKADSVFIYLLSENKTRLILMASKTPHKEELGNISLAVGEGITGWVAKENKLVAISNSAYQDSRFKGFDVLPEDRYEAFLSVPLIYKGITIGVINVQHKEAHSYTKNTINTISSIGKLVGGVIENARLYKEVKDKAVKFDSLMTVSKTITSEKYLDEILNLIVVVTAEMLNSKICSIMLLDEKRKELAIKATQSLSSDYKQKPNIKVDKSLLGEVVVSGKPLTVYDVAQEKKYAYRELAIKEKLTSMLAVPMIFKGKSTGVINIYTKEPHEFTDEEIAALQMVANQAAVAIENTKLMEEALKAKEALEVRKLVERAKGILMTMNGLNEDSAYRLIHKKSMDSCKSMKEIAESIILMDEFRKTNF